MRQAHHFALRPARATDDDFSFQQDAFPPRMRFARFATGLTGAERVLAARQAIRNDLASIHSFLDRFVIRDSLTSEATVAGRATAGPARVGAEAL
jgi:hypothetical protein